MVKLIVKLFLFLFFVSIIGLSCQKEVQSCPECELSPNAGLCLAAFQRFYFDKSEGKCKEFLWGGCGGTVPFETLEACQQCNCHN